MPRSGEDARRRLQEAALELYREQGYDGTTTAEIAARAGVTERTFFRHFADKREVLFDGEDGFRDMLVEAVKAAPAAMPPLAVLRHAFASTEPLLLRNRPFTEPRQALIAKTPALQERMVMKIASLSAALGDALATRGVPASLAALAAQAGMAAVAHATRSFLADPKRGLHAHLDDAFADLRALSL